MFMLAQTPPIPPMDRFGLPGHWAVFLTLYHVTFVLHVLFMNFALGGSIICLFNDVRSLWSRHADHLTDLNRRIFLALPIAVSFAITFGVAPLLFAQVLYGQFFYTSMILIGLPWLGILAVLIVVFYLIYLVRYEPGLLGPGWRLLRIVIAAVIAAGFAAIALMVTSNAVWSIIPDQWQARYGSGQTGLLPPWPAEPHFWWRYAHNLVGATAVACLLFAGMARALRRRGVVDDDWTRRTVYGFLLAAIGLTAVQMLAGLIMLWQFPTAVRDDVMVRSISNLHVWGWRLGIVAAVGAVACMVCGVSRPDQARWPWLALGCIVLTLGGMSMAREAVRAAYLRDHFQLARWEAKTTVQASAMGMFLISFVAALAVVGWMLWVAWGSRVKPQPPADPGPQFDPSPEPSPEFESGPESGPSPEFGPETTWASDTAPAPDQAAESTDPTES